jgi:hypothetical protein
LGLYRVLSAPEGIQTGVEVTGVEPAAAAAAEREVRRRARAFFVGLQERIAQHGDRRGQHGGKRMPSAAAVAGVGDLGEVVQQATALVGCQRDRGVQPFGGCGNAR